MSLIQIPGTTLFRDTDNMALVNRDVNGLDEYNLKRNMVINQRQEINTVKNEIQSIKSDMSELKRLLITLTQKG